MQVCTDEPNYIFIAFLKFCPKKNGLMIELKLVKCFHAKFLMAFKSVHNILTQKSEKLISLGNFIVNILFIFSI